MFCTTCGTKNPDDAKFCITCGIGLAWSGAVPSGAAKTATASNGAAGWNYYVAVLKKYTEFNGRSSRAEYWYFVLFNLLILAALTVLEGAIWPDYSIDETGPLSGVYQIAVLLPTIAAGVRRMHDTDRSGWWILVPVMNLVYSLFSGTPGPNRFGSDPKTHTA